ncbi:MAG: PAS domain-containing protein [Chloroflexi bacterium]|nr:MAG: PAS domain-containing protein [Chloroflexota bacterium]
MLADFAPLLGTDVTLAVTDQDGRLLGSHPSFPVETIRLLHEAARAEAEIVVTPQGALTALRAEGRQVGWVLASGSLPSASQTQALLKALRQALETLIGVALEKRALARETLDRYREINLLYNLGETLATCMGVQELLQRVLTQASQIIQARRGAVLLYDEEGRLTIAASTGLKPDGSLAQEGQALAEEVARTGKPQIINDFTNGEGRVPLLAVPMRTSERRLGAILLADKADGAIFTAGDEKLLAALAWQAAIFLENARLFENVRRQRDEIATMKRYMDNIFASIASGVITTDTQDVITTFNRAAEAILRVPAHEAVNRPYHQVLGFLGDTPLPTLIEEVRRYRKSRIAHEITSRLPQGERVHLSLNLSTLRGSNGETLGVAIVLDDVTEKRRYERERALVRRYLPPELVDRLPNDLAELGLRGERRIITVLFADIRGFTRFSEANPPERVVEVINNYLALAEGAVRYHRGIVDKYMGDAVMALFNTPLLEEGEHAWRAVQAAWGLQEAVAAYHQRIPPEERLFMGIGVCTGEAVVGNVGTEDRMEYTAIGDTVNVAKRLQENARPGQVLLCRRTWEAVRDRVRVKALPAVRVKGRQTVTQIYELIGLVEG